jgi:hypothetical protein
VGHLQRVPIPLVALQVLGLIMWSEADTFFVATVAIVVMLLLVSGP